MNTSNTCPVEVKERSPVSVVTATLLTISSLLVTDNALKVDAAPEKVVDPLPMMAKVAAVEFVTPSTTMSVVKVPSPIVSVPVVEILSSSASVMLIVPEPLPNPIEVLA